ncbi:hypothetical protein GCM10025862_38770 [Arsenicicoccus piscis]|uniref:Uncharacterized protein n=1 Tax=Arsenicicoccus piscis TaxID=673954 RepID=A0ABQ6HUZ2_9MICO|nr:hypothetical protein GCM10025862_38770 [Arsenicicoccus piscis]
MAELHVLEDLGDREHPDARDPGRLALAGEHQGGATAELEQTLGTDHAPDVGRVLGAAARLDVGADRVELTAELGDLRVGQVRRTRGRVAGAPVAAMTGLRTGRVVVVMDGAFFLGGLTVAVRPRGLRGRRAR